jgi:hypothetical protein
VTRFSTLTPTAEPTPAELKATFAALAKEIGPRCELSVNVAPAHSEKPLWGYCLPRGYGKFGAPTDAFSVFADTWSDLTAGIRTEWAKRSDNAREQTVKDMALAIIRITADLGQCADAALRAEFDATDVERYGADAVARANDMAELGPFEIVPTSGANARAA